MNRPPLSNNRPNFQWRDCGYVAKSLNPKDANEKYLGWIADGSLMAALNLPARKLSLAELSANIDKFDQRTKILLGIYRDVPVLEFIGVFILDLNGEHRIARLSGFLGEKGPHRNFIAFARSAFRHLFENRGVEKIRVQVAVENEAAQAACWLLGMRKEGLLRGEIRRFDGSGRSDQIAYGLLKTDWPKSLPK